MLLKGSGARSFVFVGSGLAGGAAGGWTTTGCNWCWTCTNDCVKAVVNILIVSCKVGARGGTRGGFGSGTGDGGNAGSGGNVEVVETEMAESEREAHR